MKHIIIPYTIAVLITTTVSNALSKDVIFNFLSKNFQPEINPCSTNGNCDSNELCVENFCMPPDTESMRVLESRDIPGALLAALISVSVINDRGKSPPFDILPDTNKTCVPYKVSAYKDHEKGFRFAIFTHEEGLFDVLTFKGSITIHEWLADANVLRTKCKLAPNCGKLHRGFNSAFNLLKDDIDRELMKNRDRPLIISGHSLGAGLATVASMYVAHKYPGKLHGVYLLGSPRVGNKDFVSAFQNLISSQMPVLRLSMVEGGVGGLWDPVTLAPRFGYKHVVPGHYIECTDKTDPVCKARKIHSSDLLVDVLRKLMKKEPSIQKKCAEFDFMESL